VVIDVLYILAGRVVITDCPILTTRFVNVAEPVPPIYIHILLIVPEGAAEGRIKVLGRNKYCVLCPPDILNGKLFMDPPVVI